MVLQYVSALNAKRIILASQSPRRRELIKQIGLINAEIIVSSFDEDLDKSIFANAGEYSVATAKGKAVDVFNKIKASEKKAFDVIISCDSVVAVPDGGVKIFEKANTAEHAAEMVRTLSGKKHSVCSGLVLMFPSDSTPEGYVTIEGYEETHVTFDEISEANIALYVAQSTAWQGKAGAYGIQDLASVFIPRIEGDYYTVMGLPINRLSKGLVSAIEEKKYLKL